MWKTYLVDDVAAAAVSAVRVTSEPTSALLRVVESRHPLYLSRTLFRSLPRPALVVNRYRRLRECSRPGRGPGGLRSALAE